MTSSGSSAREEEEQGSPWAAARPCDSCGSAPSVVYCRADAAALCAACDADIHSANPLAHRHQRDPIVPAPQFAAAPVITKVEQLDEPWLLYHRSGAEFSFGGDVHDYIDLVGYNSGAESQFHEDRRRYEQLVPMEFVVPNEHRNQHKQEQEHDQEQQDFLAGMGYDVSNHGFNYSNSLSHSHSHSHSQSACFSSADVGVVPEVATLTNASNSTLQASKGSIDLFTCPPLQMRPQFTPMDREAKVLRYKEKRKTRKFEKTIRYASRKAYAETRPRIKGRFAKRSEIDLEVDQILSASEGIYGIVPSF